LLADRFAEVVNVKDFGAIGNGVADDTAAIQAAINVFSGTGWNGSSWGNPTKSGKVFFPKGVYPISTTLTYNGGSSFGVTLEGAHTDGGAAGAVLRWTGAAGGTLLSTVGMVGSRIAHLQFDGAVVGQVPLYIIRIDSRSGAGQGPGAHDDVLEKVICYLGNNASSVCIVLGHDVGGGGTDQVDTIVFRDCMLLGADVGTGIKTLEGGNTTNFSIIGGTIGHLGTGVDFTLATISVSNKIRDTLFLANSVVDVLTGGPLLISGSHSEVSKKYVTGTVSSNPMPISIEDSSWVGTTAADDIIITAGGFLTLKGNYFRNSRTGTSIPKVQLGSPRNGTAQGFGGLVSTGNFFYNATNAVGNNPFQDTNSNDLFFPGGYYEDSNFPMNTVSIGDRGGIPGAAVQFPNYFPVGGVALHHQYKLTPTTDFGAKFDLVPFTELLTIAAAATTDSTFTFPAGAVIFAVSVRVTTVIPTAATFTVTATTGGTVFSTAAVSTAANSIDAGTAAGSLYTAAGTKVRITPNVNPANNSGQIRIAGYYYTVKPPTS
jgi:hypothetical protein